MRCALAISLALATAACGTIPEAARQGLAGQDIDAAIGLYGPWEDHMVLGGRSTYVWRRRLEADATAYYCELHVETGFRRIISTTQMQGFPSACRLFALRAEAKPN